jgi:hypothetical protein
VRCWLQASQREQIEDALAVCFTFNTVDRLSRTFVFVVPGPKAFQAGAKYLLAPRLPLTTAGVMTLVPSRHSGRVVATVAKSGSAIWPISALTSVPVGRCDRFFCPH